MDTSDLSSALPDAWTMSIWLHCGAVMPPQHHSAARDVSKGAGTGSVPRSLLLHQWITELFPPSLFCFSVRASQCSIKFLMPVPFISVHHPNPADGSLRPSPQSPGDFLGFRIVFYWPFLSCLWQQFSSTIPCLLLMSASLGNTSYAQSLS